MIVCYKIKKASLLTDERPLFLTCVLSLFFQEEIAKDLLSGDDEETQSSADDLTPSVTSHETSDFFPRPLRCKRAPPLPHCVSNDATSFRASYCVQYPV